MLEIKTMKTELKIAFDELTSRQDTEKERMSEFEDISIKTSKTKKETNTKKQNKTKNPEGLWDTYKTCNVCVMKRECTCNENENTRRKKKRNNI